MIAPKQIVILLVICLVLLQSSVLGYAQTALGQMDIFSQENIKIESAQTIHRLLLANANAIVAGAVKEGIVVVDGNLTLMPEAKVQGQIIVLGGELRIEPGASLENTPWVIAKGRVSVRNLVAGILCLLFIAPLVVLFLLLWGIRHFWRHKSWYRRLRRQFFWVQHRYPIIYIAGTLTISGIMLAAFSDLVWRTIFRHTMGVFDNAFIWLIRYFATARLDKVMIFITNLGYGFTYDLIVVCSFVALAILKRYMEMRGLAVCLFGGAILNEILKRLFERARPDTFHIVEAAGYSFPSGHAMVSLCFYGMIAFLLARTISLWRWRMVVLISSALFILLIGISRIYLGVHYPSDVLAGYTAGATWLSFSISLLMWQERKRRRLQHKEGSL